MRTYSSPVTDGFCIIGHCRINGYAAYFPAVANRLSNKLVIVSDSQQPSGFLMPSAPWVFFIIGQLEEFSKKSCRNKSSSLSSCWICVFHTMGPPWPLCRYVTWIGHSVHKASLSTHATWFGCKLLPFLIIYTVFCSVGGDRKIKTNLSFHNKHN